MKIHLVAAVPLVLANFCLSSPIQTRKRGISSDYYSGIADIHGGGQWTASHGSESGYSVEENNFEGAAGGAADNGATQVTSFAQQVPVPVPQPFTVTINRPVPVPVQQPYTVEVPRPVQVPIPIPRQVVVPRPVPVTVNRPVPVPVPQIIRVPYAQPYNVPVPQPYPVNIPQPVPVRVPQTVVVPVPQPVYVNGGAGGQIGVGETEGAGLGSGNQFGYGDHGGYGHSYTISVSHPDGKHGGGASSYSSITFGGSKV